MELLMETLTNNRRRQVWFTTPSHNQCREVFEHKLMPIIMRGGRMLPSVAKVLHGTPRAIIMKNGNWCEFHTLERFEYLRAASLTDLFVDEAAYARDGFYDRALAPMLARRGQRVYFTSTPSGNGNQFAEWWRRGVDPDFPTWGALHSTYLETGDARLIAYIEELRKYTSDDTFRQEYLAEFVDGGGAVFRNVVHLFTMTEPASPSARNFFGIDLGMEHDRTVITVLNDRGELVYFKRFTLAEQRDSGVVKQTLAGILATYPGMRGYMETNFNPMMLQEVWKEVNNRGVMMTGFFTTAQNKTGLVNGLVHAIDTAQIKLQTPNVHPDMAQVKVELEDYESDFSEVRRITRFNAPAGGHDDCVMSLALAVHARNYLNI